LNEYTEANRRHWDECVPLHVASEMYDVESFKAGKSKLKPVELAELRDVRGKTMLHLQCHFGLDTLSWARDEGAIVTGTDFSEPAISAARKLAAECGIDATFLVSELYTLPENLAGQFDIVYTGYGALCWLPDIVRWAEVAAHFVKPGGTFYMVEFHPIAGIFDKPGGVTELIVRYPYFTTSEPLMFADDGTYADRNAKLQNRVTYSWPHPTSEVITALIDAGLRIDFFHEFQFSTEQVFPFMEETARDTLRLTKHGESIPLMYSIKATKPA
jgi:SAM-dependent methyltransferase